MAARSKALRALITSSNDIEQVCTCVCLCLCLCMCLSVSASLSLSLALSLSVSLLALTTASNDIEQAGEKALEDAIYENDNLVDYLPAEVMCRF